VVSETTESIKIREVKMEFPLLTDIGFDSPLLRNSLIREIPS